MTNKQHVIDPDRGSDAIDPGLKELIDFLLRVLLCTVKVEEYASQHDARVALLAGQSRASTFQTNGCQSFGVLLCSDGAVQ